MEQVHECFECESKFTVQAEFDIEDLDVSFCPFCGSELEFEPEEGEIEEFDD